MSDGVPLPAGVRTGVEAALGGPGSHLTAVRPLGGGCVSPAARITTADHGSYFLKWDAGGGPAGLFEAEAHALGVIAAVGAVRVPAVIAVGEDWLLLEWLPTAPRATHTAWSGLGRDIAALHRARAARFGWDRDNFIGPLPQANARLESWPAFWRDRRLSPQLERARRAGLLGRDDAAAFDRLFTRWHGVLSAAQVDGASLLHGDLWNGNVVLLEGGGAAVIDPSTSHGHREVDLAMAALFGGFDQAFERAYAEAWPLEPGHETRRRIYQLYYLLVHVNLFGVGYVPGTRTALDRALAGC